MLIDSVTDSVRPLHLLLEAHLSLFFRKPSASSITTVAWSITTFASLLCLWMRLESGSWRGWSSCILMVMPPCHGSICHSCTDTTHRKHPSQGLQGGIRNGEGGTGGGGGGRRKEGWRGKDWWKDGRRETEEERGRRLRKREGGG